MKQTGHRSQDAVVGKYKRTSSQHDLLVYDILQPPAPKKLAMSESHLIFKKIL